MLQTTKLSKNFLFLINVAERNKVNIIGGGGNCENKIIKKSLFKNLNKVAEYLIFEARLAFTHLKKNVYQYSDLPTIWSKLLYSDEN